MNNQPVISICIPAYRRVEFLDRLLQSIAIQTYTLFEVIITDDSPTNEVQLFVENKSYDFPLRYYKNPTQIGTPANWMEGIKYASGNWIKIIHDDDWFNDADSLKIYAEYTTGEAECIFSGYKAFFESSNKLIDKGISVKQFNKIKAHPYYLFGDNLIGPPSVALFKKSIVELYDPQLKWLVDLEAYVRMLTHYNCIYIPVPLVIMSYNNTQVTNECFRNPDVEIREALIYYKKHGEIVRKRLMTYDAWWRMLRNLGIRNIDQLEYYSKGEVIPGFLYQILNFQKRIPIVFLKQGFFSKLLMFISYILNR
jgi:glycosyltransferase involved in cell wall biosynthesis